MDRTQAAPAALSLAAGFAVTVAVLGLTLLTFRWHHVAFLDDSGNDPPAWSLLWPPLAFACVGRWAPRPAWALPGLPLGIFALVAFILGDEVSGSEYLVLAAYSAAGGLVLAAFVGLGAATRRWPRPRGGRPPYP